MVGIVRVTSLDLFLAVYVRTRWVGSLQGRWRGSM